MLQIVSGKFFDTNMCYETLHRGVYFTNYQTLDDAPITIPIGCLLPSTGLGGSVRTVTYELMEKIEWETPSPGVLISTGGAELVESLADVLSFVLRVLWSPEADLVRRLTAESSLGASSRRHPKNTIRRVFDVQVMSRPGDGRLINEFLLALIGLERASYEGAIRAIRRYVTATHRIVDDTSLAYALFVMSIEALAQATDAPMAAWEDYDEIKRERIDNALDGAPGDMAERVRAAVLRNEHVALGRRFRSFAIDHLSPAFFRDEAEGAIAPISRTDLETVLKRAYEIRSGYVHRLKSLPKLLAEPFHHSETFEIDGQPTLTFEGLARLARHVIIQFVQRARKVEHEDFHWRAALPNLMTASLAPQYWIGRPEEYTVRTARMWLKHFLTQVTAVLLGTLGATLTDLSAVLGKIETLDLDNVKPHDRRPILALYHLFLSLAGSAYQRTQHQELIEQYQADFASPSVEELVVCLVTKREFAWQVDQIEELHTVYHRERHHKDALPLGRVLEALFTLRLAEANRAADRNHRACELISFAVEAYPGHSALRALEMNLGEEPISPIMAYEILFGKKPEAA